jgi:hypothetical protein
VSTGEFQRVFSNCPQQLEFKVTGALAGGMEQGLTMRRKYLIGLIVAVIALGATAGGFTVAAVTSDEENVTGPEADAAGQAALAITGGGTVLEVEHGDDEGAVWEVEVRKPDGQEVEVLLDGGLQSVGVFPGDDAGEGPDDDADGEDQH